MEETRLIKARAIIKDLLSVLPKENTEGVYEVTDLVLISENGEGRG